MRSLISADLHFKKLKAGDLDYNKCQELRKELFCSTARAILEKLNLPQETIDQYTDKTLSPDDMYGYVIKSLKGHGFSVKQSQKVIQQAEGIMMTRIKDDPVIQDKGGCKIFRVSSRNLKQDIKEPSGLDKASKFLFDLFSVRMSAFDSRKMPTLVESSITKQEYAGIRNFRVHQYSGPYGVNQIHAHAYIMGNSRYKENLEHLKQQCGTAMAAYKNFYGAERDLIFNVSLIDGGDGGWLSKKVNQFRNFFKDNEFEMAKLAEKTRSENTFDFDYFSANSTLNTYGRTKVKVCSKVIESARKAVYQRMRKLSSEEDKEKLANDYNQMNAKILGSDGDVDFLEKCEASKIRVADKGNIEGILTQGAIEIEQLSNLYQQLEKAPLDMQVVLKPALEAMIMSRCGHGVSLGCKSGKDRTFVVMAMVNAIERFIQIKPNMTLQSLCKKEFAEVMKEEALDVSGRLIAMDNCDGAFGTKTGYGYMPNTIKKALSSVDREQLKAGLSDSNQCANLNNFKISLLSKLQFLIGEILEMTVGIVRSIFSQKPKVYPLDKPLTDSSAHSKRMPALNAKVKQQFISKDEEPKNTEKLLHNEGKRSRSKGS
jgi:hypothetical protein